MQLSTFFQDATSFSVQVVNAVQKDPSFATCHWSHEEVDTSFYLVEIHGKAAKSVRNQCDEVLKLIDWQWSLKAKNYIRSKGL